MENSPSHQARETEHIVLPLLHILSLYSATIVTPPSEELLPRKQQSPQEKKRDSYEKDRRNTYGENAKASRKLIPKQRAAGSRALRRIANQALASAAALNDSEVIDALVPRLEHKRRRSWKKFPDEPLKTVIPQKRKRREVGVNRKKIARARRQQG